MKTYITSITLILFFLLAGPQLVFSQVQEDSDPISFELVNAQGDDIVFIDNDAASKGQTMRMVLLNNDLNPLMFNQPKGGTVAKDNFHFKLEVKHNRFKYFEKGVLDNIRLSSESGGFYQMLVNTDDSEYAYFYILIKDVSSYILQPNERKLIGLTGFKASSKSGPMASVPIRLHYHNAHYQSDPKASISNTFDSEIRIKNKNGLENIPIHAGLLGSQSILNDGKTANSLTIGLENVAIPNPTHPEADKIYYDKNTTIVISYKLEPNDKAPWAYPWALTTKNEFKNSATLPIIKLNNGTQPTSYWKAEKSTDGTSWVLTAQGRHSLSPKNVLKIELGGIVSAMPDGVSHIYVYYNNIEGYYDGFFSIPVSKSAIFEHDQSIMIGTTIPEKIVSQPLALNVKGYSGFNGLRLNGQDTGNTIYSGKSITISSFNATKGHKMDINLKPSGKVMVKSDLVVNNTNNLQDQYGAIMPKGAIIMWSSSSVPAGWNLCDGTNGTPDLRNRFIISAGGNYPVHQAKGNSSFTITTDNLPAHKHNIVDPGHKHSGHITQPDFSWNTFMPDDNPGYKNAYGFNKTPTSSLSLETDSKKTGITTTKDTGKGTAIEHLPPYYALSFIMKI